MQHERGKKIIFMKKLTISLTGHRPPKLAGYNMDNPYYKRMQEYLEELIEKAIHRCDILELHSGMALGADTVWAQAIIAKKMEYPNKISLVADIPDMGQPSRWPKPSQDLWTELMKQADMVNTYAQNNTKRSYGYILNQRNIGMVDACDILIAIYDGTPGGTHNAVNYGMKKQKYIHQVHPRTFR